MVKTPAPHPTDGELAILSVLWSRGPSTVREVHDAQTSRGTGYTTVLKLMQIMVEKGILARDETQRSHVYRPLLEERAVRKTLVSDLMSRLFGGSAAELLQSALSSRPTSREELDAIRRLLDESETSATRKRR